MFEAGAVGFMGDLKEHIPKIKEAKNLLLNTKNKI